MVYNYRCIVFLLAIASTLLRSDCFADIKIEELNFPTNSVMERATLYFCRVVENPRAVVVLCPGMNECGRDLILSPQWQEYAHDQHLALAGISFASPEALLKAGGGYYRASQGSGQLLLDGIDRVFQPQPLPLLIYGFSGGAHFTSSFVQWAPDRVVAWCADAAGWWEPPQGSADGPPGIVACGEADDRYGASLQYFIQGRALRKRWTWVSLRGVGHQANPALDDFARLYFAAVVTPRALAPEWLDIDLKTPVTTAEMKSHPTLACWLPDRKTARAWIELHQP